uniref:beta-N-acetylhexosaminidase n=1 Tax=Nilaparvata lugens TaxID=108931 RepID=A0A0C5CE47_NILLU|nr:beta-N-acetylhexosaminidase [Nilaparvata lugens]
MEDVEIIEINGLPVPHRVHSIPGDGACLFSALSYAMYGCISHSRRVRAEIVTHASTNWERLHIYSMNQECQSYQSLEEYISTMSMPYTYGTSFELEVAKDIYPFQFEVYINCILNTGNTYGNAPNVRRLKFMGELTQGHFDVYVPYTQQPATNNALSNLQSENDCSSVKFQNNCNVTVLEDAKKTNKKKKKRKKKKKKKEKKKREEEEEEEEEEEGEEEEGGSKETRRRMYESVRLLRGPRVASQVDGARRCDRRHPAGALSAVRQQSAGGQRSGGRRAGGRRSGGERGGGAQLFAPQPQQQSVSAAVVAAENSVHFVANNHQPTNYPNGAGDAVLSPLPKDLKCELLLVQISRLSKSIYSLIDNLNKSDRNLEKMDAKIELQQDVMSRMKDANTNLKRKLVECCCQQNIELNSVVEVQSESKAGLTVADVALNSDLAFEKIASACFIRQEREFAALTNFGSDKVDSRASLSSDTDFRSSQPGFSLKVEGSQPFNSLRRRIKTCVNWVTKDARFRYSWNSLRDEGIVRGKGIKHMNSESDLLAFVNKGFQNQDLLDNNNAGNQRLDDVNNLLLGGQGGGVGLMDSLDDHAGSSNGGGSRSIYVPGQRLMHFDLKGAPPRVSYLKRMMPLAKELGATGVLIEWEDMFPWAGRLAPLAAGNAYSRQDVQEIIDAAVSNGLEVIPLVQTFGHVEFALKHSEFSELREVPESPQALCPSLNTSHDFVHQMIEQVMDMHKNIRYLHIGCDEVFQMGECVRCRSQPRDTLFLQHVTRVAQFVRTRHPGVTPIIWDDMLRHLPPISLEQYRIGELVEPMVWVYAEDVYRFVPSSVWDKYAAVFARVWAASAFKGAFGETLQVPNAKRHLDNNMRWLQVMQTEAPKFSGGFQGIAITGWQRYDHFAVLCELLPSAIPSLAVTLLATSHGYFNQSLRPKLNSALSCGVFV